MPLRKQTPPGVPSALLTISTSCPYCTAGRAARDRSSPLNRLRRLFKRRRSRSIASPSSVCHACGLSGFLNVSFQEVKYDVERGVVVDSEDQQLVGPANETLGEALDDDAASDFTVRLHGLEVTASRRPTGSDPGFVEDWVSGQRSDVVKRRRWERWQRWSRQKLVRAKPSRRRPKQRRAGLLVPRQLETIPEDEEPIFMPRPRLIIE
ncbi:hypothetical protein CkaCkLH20_08374 [Colletotrichum karsti]|uniref:Uncharacterized protein n=1 Tax=Colletotrichum karsti TaxID=1095194 RepID=A0A9P6HZ46_9PEZI|nr:uncharacterized protein CkaCkLH20_08374 [Colletotrichum karsti]KAF9874002.1 hypothetical protein CkaCkLH20_08374 [Colletotrichum karsti]